MSISDIVALKCDFETWMTQEQAKLPMSKCGYRFGFVDPRKYPGWK